MNYSLVDFYPTPISLIQKLLEGLELNKFDSILDLGAGKGDISDYIREHVNDAIDGRRHWDYRRNVEIDVVEIHPDLQHILRGKEYRLIHDDILTFQTRKSYDLIVANFPFSIGDKCLTIAIDLLERFGGELRCFVNAETIKNSHSTLRQVLVRKLEKLNANIEFLEGEFESAERTTSVEVALIKLSIEKKKEFSILLNHLKKSQKHETEIQQSSAIMETDYVRTFVSLFNAECDTVIKLLKEYYAFLPHIKDSLKKQDGDRDYSKPIIELKIKDRSAGSSISDDINNYLKAARSKYWELLINDGRFRGQFTSNILKELDEKLKELEDYDFSVFNITELYKDLQSKLVKGVEKAILDLFDTLTAKHSYYPECTENVWYYNGWKTNTAHKINKKVILPMHGLEKDWCNSKKAKFNYYTDDKLTDMVKVFNYLSREKMEGVRQLVGNSIRYADTHQDFDLDLRYFRIKFYKKGTAHIWFKDLELLEKFNIFGSQRKNWLPPNYGKTKYEDLNQEEKEIIDSFQGKEEYEKVVIDSEFFLVDEKQILLLAE